MMMALTSPKIASYCNRYASAVYVGGGYAPRNGLMHRRAYVGHILDGGRFHVLNPDRMCYLSEFTDYELVTRRWAELNEAERALLVRAYSQRKVSLQSLASERFVAHWQEIAADLVNARYLRRVDGDEVELTSLGEAEVEHAVFKKGAGDNVLTGNGGIRIEHHSIHDHEVDLGRKSVLSVNVDGMLIRIYTLQHSGALIRVDHDKANRVVMNRVDPDKGFAQLYVDRVPARIMGAREASAVGDEQ